MSLSLKMKHKSKVFITKFIKLLFFFMKLVSLHFMIRRENLSRVNHNTFSGNTVKLIHQSKKIILVPYRSFDCELLYSHLNRNLNDTGLVSKIQNSDRDFAYFYRQIPQIPKGSYTYREKLEIFLEVFGNGTNSARGAIDEYRHLASPHELLATSPFDPGIWKRIMTERNRAIELSELGDAFVTPDLGYTFNRTLLEQAHNQGKKLFVINPRGFVTNASDIHRLPTSRRNTHEIMHQLELHKKTFQCNDKLLARNPTEGANQYFKDFSSDINQSQSKILFLHCLRDSDSGILPRRDLSQMPFLDYLEWTEFALENISRNPDGWRIRIHPHSKRFAGEEILVHTLLQKYSIPRNLIESNTVNLKKLVKTSSIFTHSGTIGLEIAALGKLANCCSTFFPTNLSNRLLTKEEISSAFHLSPSSDQINCFLDTKEQDLASFCLELLTSNEQQVAQASVPKRKLERNHDDFYRTLGELRLASNYTLSINGRSSRLELLEISDWIREEIEAQEISKHWILAKSIYDLRD